MGTGNLALTSEERRHYDEFGYLVRESVLTREEVAEMTRACEELCDNLAADSRDEHKFDVSAFYVFETDVAHNTLIKWEPGNRSVIQGLEPLAHLHPVLDRYARHPALSEPSRQLLGFDAVDLFTEKLNMKRAGVGGAYALHRDLPYWLGDAEDPHHMLTVLVTLDDATPANGALEVLPRSHRIENPPFKESDLEFERNELDPDRMDMSEMVPVEMGAGSAVFFGPMLIHRSGPNRSHKDRRTLLFTYQRPGLRDQRVIQREWNEKYLGAAADGD